jgi:hypothetical protein
MTERQIVQMGLQVAARNGDPRPTMIQHSEGPRDKANRITAGAYIGGAAQSYLIAVRGHFIAYDASVPAGASLPRGTVLTLIVNAATGRVTDGGITYSYPPLARLGPVTTDFRSYPTCPATDRPLPSSLTPGARGELVPGHPDQVLLCRGGVAHRLVVHQAVVTQLAAQFDALEALPKGVYHCPADFGLRIVAIFRYTARPESDDPVTLDPYGCRPVTNGRLSRTASLPPGQALIDRLDALTPQR